MIKSSRLNKRLNFSEVIETENDYGEVIKTLKFRFSIFGEPVQQESQREINSDGSDYSKVYVFRIRYKPQINQKLIITVDGQDLQITNIENVKHRNREMIIDAINYIQD